jgi:hypothetical protein
MNKFNKSFYKTQLLKIYGDKPTTRKMMMYVDLTMKDREYYTWNEFVSIFSFAS